MKKILDLLRRLVQNPIFEGFLHLIRSLIFSFHGFKACYVQEIAFRQECAVAIPHFIAIVLLPLPMWLRFYMSSLWFVVILAELLNTSIEAVVDIASPKWHELAKKSKDCASAAVFCAILLFSLSWIVVIVDLIWKVFK